MLFFILLESAQIFNPLNTVATIFFVLMEQATPAGCSSDPNNVGEMMSVSHEQKRTKIFKALICFKKIKYVKKVDLSYFKKANPLIACW